jgi:membrane-bound lytic murein transglycosylase B
VPPALLAGLAAEPAGLARQLTDALHTIRDPASSPAAVDAAGRRQQLVLRRLAAHADWQADTLAAVGDDVRAFATNDVTALNAPGDRALAKPVPPLETLPAWTIRAPLPAAELLGYYREAEAATGIPWPYLAAINLVETRMGRIAGLSTANAIGPMQFLRSTWDACCTGDPTVDRDAIIGAATYLRRRGGPADMGRAILGYNPNDAYRVMIERYAANLAADERLYLGYHAWEVFVATTSGPVRLPVGFAATERLPAAEYVAAHPEDRA